MTAVCHSNKDRWDNTIPQLEICKTYKCGLCYNRAFMLYGLSFRVPGTSIWRRVIYILS